MRRTFTNVGGMVAAFALLAGCATSKEALLPHGPATMLDVWEQYAVGTSQGSGASRELLRARSVLRRPLAPSNPNDLIDSLDAYTRTAATEIYQQFERLPNPDMLMFVFPHLAGTEPVPVPGYTTVFSFYERTHYAMPGERTDDY